MFIISQGPDGPEVRFDEFTATADDAAASLYRVLTRFNLIEVKVNTHHDLSDQFVADLKHHLAKWRMSLNWRPGNYTVGEYFEELWIERSA